MQEHKRFVALQGPPTYCSKLTPSRHISRGALFLLHPDVSMETIGHIDPGRPSFAHAHFSVRPLTVFVLQVPVAKRTRLRHLCNARMTNEKMDTTRTG